MAAMQVWKFDDCDYVAAATLEAAQEWYDHKFGPCDEREGRVIEERSLDEPIVGEGETTSLRAIVEGMQAEGTTFPAIVAIDGHYA